MTAISILSGFWNEYNTPDSISCFLLPFLFWFTCWFYCKRNNFDYARWDSLHRVHHAFGIFQALLSLYLNDDAIFNERITILWSIPYFLIDIIDCIWERHFTYAIHAFLCLSLGITNYSRPLFRELRMNSKANFIETSTFVLHKAKQNRNPVVFCAFAFTFTCCRILWIPVMMHQLYQNGILWYDVSFLLLIGFYGLNLFWYSKIIGILLKGDEKDKDYEDMKPKEESKKVD
jgi:hypothetical protein